MIIVNNPENQIPNEQLRFFLSELMGEEADKYLAEQEAKQTTQIIQEAVTETDKAVTVEVVKKEIKATEPKVKLPEAKDKRILAKLGDKKFNELAVLEECDSGVYDVTMARDFLLNRLAHAPQKIRNRLAYFLEYLGGVSSSLRNVLEMAVRLLCKDGCISASNKKADVGNFYQKLIDYPYTPTSSSAMGNNTIKAMQVLKMVVPDEKDRLVLNPKSTLLKLLRTRLDC